MVKNLSAMQETWVQSLGQEDPLEKGMATHSSILAWRIPWTEEDDRLQSVGSQRVGHDWATFTFFTECICSVLKTIYMGGYMVSPSLEVCVRTPLRAGFIENSNHWRLRTFFEVDLSFSLWACSLNQLHTSSPLELVCNASSGAHPRLLNQNLLFNKILC